MDRLTDDDIVDQWVSIFAAKFDDCCTSLDNNTSLRVSKNKENSPRTIGGECSRSKIVPASGDAAALIDKRISENNIFHDLLPVDDTEVLYYEDLSRVWSGEELTCVRAQTSLTSVERLCSNELRIEDQFMAWPSTYELRIVPKVAAVVSMNTAETRRFESKNIDVEVESPGSGALGWILSDSRRGSPSSEHCSRQQLTDRRSTPKIRVVPRTQNESKRSIEKTRLEPRTIEYLRNWYAKTTYVTSNEARAIAESCGIAKRTVDNWFKNQRWRDKKGNQ